MPVEIKQASHQPLAPSFDFQVEPTCSDRLGQRSLSLRQSLRYIQTSSDMSATVEKDLAVDRETMSANGAVAPTGGSAQQGLPQRE